MRPSRPSFTAFVAFVLACKTSTSQDEWTHRMVADRENKFHLLWTPSEEKIIFEIQAETLGYVAIGFSPNGAMRGADIFLGWVDDDNGTISAHDRYAIDTLPPVVDPSQDYELLGGFQNDTHTVIRFSRAWDTCDEQGDFALDDSTVRLLWAHHPEDPYSTEVLPYHGRLTRGARSVHLKQLPQLRGDLRDPDVKHWDLRADNLMLPTDDHTHYWCKIFKAPHMDRKHHMIGFQPLIQRGHESYLHHMVLYECHVPPGTAGDGSDPSQASMTSRWFEHHVGHEGARCYSPNMPPEWAFCLATNTWAWAVGSSGEMLPDHVGIPLGEDHGGATYFMLETHYDNPAMHQDIVDNSGIRILYTQRLRAWDASMLLVGSEVNFLHLIPPKQQEFITVGRCTEECTSRGLPAEGIRILNGVLHSHLAGREMRLRHVRKGKELDNILKDLNYDFNFQASRRPDPPETLVLPGDELILECKYQTVQRDRPTFGGLSTRDEMCLGFILYYPRAPVADCRSLPSLNTVMEAFGIQEIYGKSFQKLALFLKDIGDSNDESGKTLSDLLEVLASETGRDLRTSSFQHQPLVQQPPLTEEDLLKQPFYTVDNSHLHQPGVRTAKDYRTFMSDMLLSLRIKSPLEMSNVTIGDHLASMNWEGDQKLAEKVQRIMVRGNHNSLCLAHGRKPIIKYKETPYPRFEELFDKPSENCSPHPAKETEEVRRKLEDTQESIPSKNNSIQQDLPQILYVKVLNGSPEVLLPRTIPFLITLYVVFSSLNNLAIMQ